LPNSTRGIDDTPMTTSTATPMTIPFVRSIVSFHFSGLRLRELYPSDQPRMNVRNVLSAQHPFPGWHRPPSTQHSLPEQILVLENRTLRKLRAHTAHSPRSMTSLAIELIDTGSSGSHTSDRTISYRLLRQRLCLLQRAVKWREAVGRAR